MAPRVRCYASAVSLVLAVACSSAPAIEPLTVTEASWCRTYVSLNQWQERGSTMGIDLTEAIAAAEVAYAETEAAGGDVTARATAAYETLESDDGYIQVCRAAHAQR